MAINESIGIPLLGWLWSCFKSYWPSAVELVPSQVSYNDEQLELSLALKNAGNVPITAYAMTVHLPVETAERVSGYDFESAVPVDGYLRFSVDRPFREVFQSYGFENGKVVSVKAPTSAEKPLLPAGPSVTLIKICITMRTPSEKMLELPIIVDYWGGSGKVQSAKLFPYKADSWFFKESSKPLAAKSLISSSIAPDTTSSVKLI